MVRTSRISAPAILLALSIAAILGGCAGRPSQGVLVPTAQVAPGNTNVPIYVVTNRKRSDVDPGEMFSGERSDELSFAEVTVSIPPDAARKVGDVQWPASLPGDPQRDFTTVSADYLDKTHFAASVTAAHEAVRSQQGACLRPRLQQPLRRCGLSLRADRARFQGAGRSRAFHLAIARRAEAARLYL